MSAKAQTIRIGRGQGCDLVLTHSSVSRRHAELILDSDGSIAIRDLESTGGTFVLRGKKEIPVTRMELDRTDRLRLGDYEISVEDLLSLAQEAGLGPRAETQSAAGRSVPPPLPVEIQTGERPKSRMVRCACGTIKERGKPCPQCGA